MDLKNQLRIFLPLITISDHCAAEVSAKKWEWGKLKFMNRLNIKTKQKTQLRIVLPLITISDHCVTQSIRKKDGSGGTFKWTIYE